MKVFTLVAYDSSVRNDFNSTVLSLNNCQPAPTAIGIIQSSTVPQSLKKKSRVVMYKPDKYAEGQVKPLDVMQLIPKLLEDYKQEKDEDVYFMIVTPGNSYPKHIIDEYLRTHGKMSATLEQKLKESKNAPPFKGSVFGLSGIFLVSDPKKLMDMELQCLQDGIDMPEKPPKNSIGYVNSNATVELLEFNGSVFFNSKHIKAEWFDSTLQNRELINSVPNDMLFSNVCSLNGILRSQICAMTFNRFVFERMGLIRNHNEKDKTLRYLSGIEYMENNKHLITIWGN